MLCDFANVGQKHTRRNVQQNTFTAHHIWFYMSELYLVKAATIFIAFHTISSTKAVIL